MLINIEQLKINQPIITALKKKKKHLDHQNMSENI